MTRDPRYGQDLARSYAQIVGVVIVLLGVLGLVLGDQRLGGILNIDLAEDVFHLVAGGVLAYAGFALPNNSAIRSILGTIGVVFLVVGVLGAVSATLFGLIPSGYTVLDNVFHAALGIISLAVVWLTGRQSVASKPD